ncbi:hypothetical protein LCGC14_3158410, partial [marine sediment metagenome]
MNSSTPQQPASEIKIPGGKVFVTSYGQITVETTFSLVNMAIRAVKMGLDN